MHAPNQCTKNKGPWKQKAETKLPIWCTHAILNVSRFFYDFSPTIFTDQLIECHSNQNALFQQRAKLSKMIYKFQRTESTSQVRIDYCSSSR